LLGLVVAGDTVGGIALEDGDVELVFGQAVPLGAEVTSSQA
jgi:hypothetical protein